MMWFTIFSHWSQGCVYVSFFAGLKASQFSISNFQTVFPNAEVQLFFWKNNFMITWHFRSHTRAWYCSISFFGRVSALSRERTAGLNLGETKNISSNKLVANMFLFRECMATLSFWRSTWNKENMFRFCPFDVPSHAAMFFDRCMLMRHVCVCVPFFFTKKKSVWIHFLTRHVHSHENRRIFHELFHHNIGIAWMQVWILRETSSCASLHGTPGLIVSVKWSTCILKHFFWKSHRKD